MSKATAMKIHKLEIKNLRGIPDLSIELQCKSLVIYGANGSGKSGVIDALDFLLTGRMARLLGEGTEGVSLKEHGPHIDMVADLGKVEVTALVALNGISEHVSITRRMDAPKKLIYDAKYNVAMTPLIELLDRGQHVFTRRELLKLITAKSSTRAQEIQKVLKLEDLESTRKNLVSVYNDFKAENKVALDAVKKCQTEVILITGQPHYNFDETLKFVNDQRVLLGGKALEKLLSDKIKNELPNIQTNPEGISHEELTKRFSNLKMVKLAELIVEANIADRIIRTTLAEIREDNQASWNMKRHEFTKEGISLIRESCECPLCDKEWAIGELESYLQQRIDAQSSREEQLKNNCTVLLSCINAIEIKIQQVLEFLTPVIGTEKAKDSVVVSLGNKMFSDWKSDISIFKTALKSPMDLYTIDDFNVDDTENLYIPLNLDLTIESFEKEIKSLFPEATPKQAAWDNLTKLIERIRMLEESTATQIQTSLVMNRAEELGKAYVNARDEILEGLYDIIKDRFVGLYKEMHGNDEKSFSALFTPSDAGLNMEVDFYGRGFHPPHAMHSEGHQDSMGVCLFLALSEHLNTGLVDIVILDDVVMSIDSGHRRSFCDVLVNNFPNKQFVLTTHDTTWANQLRSSGLVQSKQMLKFSNWTVGDGPDVHYEADMWGRIQTDLDNDDVPAAAAKLRRCMEEHIRYVCHNLRAKVPYTIDDAGSLGDFLDSAISRYKDILGDAKKAAISWAQTTVVTNIEIAEQNFQDVIKRTNAEQWGINKAVHYNEWGNFQKADFTPIVEAFKDLYQKIFSCSVPGCESVLELTFKGASKSGLRCKCGNTSINLLKK